MSFSKHHCSKSPFKKEGGDPPEKDNITTSYTYEPGNNTAASRFKEIVGGVSSGNGEIKEEDTSSKGKKKPQGRHVSVKI